MWIQLGFIDMYGNLLMVELEFVDGTLELLG